MAGAGSDAEPEADHTPPQGLDGLPDNRPDSVTEGTDRPAHNTARLEENEPDTVQKDLGRSKVETKEAGER